MSPNGDPMNPQDHMQQVLEAARLKLLDTTARNALISYKHNERNKYHVRIIDEIIDILHDKLDGGTPLTLRPLPDAGAEPEDERTDAFLEELAIAKETNETYRLEIEQLPDTEDLTSRQYQRILRVLKDHVREKLNMPRRVSPELMSKAEYAIQHGLIPDFEMPQLQENMKVEARWEDHEIQTLMFSVELNENLTKINRKYKQSLEEKGANTLFIVFGFLEWYESENSDRKLLSPILLENVDIEQRSGARGFKYSIRASDEMLQCNRTLQEKLRRECGVQLPDFNDDEDGDTPDQYLQNVASLVQAQPRWTVRRFVTICHLEYSQVLMFQDLDPKGGANETLLSSSTVKEVLFGTEHDPMALSEDYQIDENPKVRDSVPHLILDADASQHSAVVDALGDSNMALKGPPGTGKSQTITNIVGALLGQNKTVLFVSAKAAALDVVYSRLKNVGLGEFCLKLHAKNTKPKEFIESLKSRMGMEAPKTNPDFDNLANQLSIDKEKLNKYVGLLNQQYGATGKTIQEIMWTSIKADEECTKVERNATQDIFLENCKTLTSLDVDTACNQLASLAQLIDRFEEKFQSIQKHPFYGFQKQAITTFELEEIRGLLDRLHETIGASISLIENCSASVTQEEYSSIATVGHIKQINETLSTISLPSESEEELVNYIWADGSTGPLRAVLGTAAEIVKLRSKLEGKCFTRDVHFNGVEELIKAVASYEDLSLIIGEELSERPVASSQPFLKDCVRLRGNNLDILTSVIGELSELLGMRPNYSYASIQAWHRLVKLVEGTNRNVFLLGNGDLLNEKNHRIVEQILREAENLSESEADIKGKYVIDFSDLSYEIENLRGDRKTIASAGLLSFFYSSYRKARKRFTDRQREAQKCSDQKIERELGRIIEFLTNLQAFQGNERYQSIIKMSYTELKCSNSLIREVVKYAQGARQCLSNFANAEARTIRDFLFGNENDKLVQFKDNTESGVYAKMDVAIEQLSISQSNQGIDILEQKSQMSALAENLPDLDLRNSVQYKDLALIRQQLESIQSKCTTLETEARSRQIPINIQGVNAASIARANEILDGMQVLRSTCLDFPVLRSILEENINNNIKVVKNCFAECNVNASRISEQIDVFLWKGEVEEQVLLSENSSTTVSFYTLQNLIKQKLDYLEDILDWTKYQKIRHENVNLHLDLIVNLYEQAPERINSLASVYKKVFYRSLMEQIYKEYPNLASLSGLDMNRARKQFADCDRKITKLYCDKLVVQLMKRKQDAPRGTYALAIKNRTEMHYLNHFIQAGNPRTPPVRKLLKKAGVSLQVLKPVFMMSPLSISQFLPLGQLQFDTVLIDEASQLKPEATLGALARAKNAIIVGDPMQLPPSSFYEKNLSNDDQNVEEIDEESILDMALAKFPIRRDLKWHYRSKDETLIAFSNNKFYDDRLIVFPSSDHAKNFRGIKINYVEGLYKGRQNHIEAKHITDSVSKFMRDHRDKSCLVVTMNVQQTELIQSMMEKNQGERHVREYMGKWENTLEPFTVKNLENVQGDERDCIFISTVYGPPEQGGVTAQQFGPINSQLGHRRLNVLFTRAKERVEVCTSMNPQDIMGDEGAPFGRRILKQYLQYGLTGRLYQGETSGRESGSPFQSAVGDKLREKGYEVEHEVGVKGYFIDIGVKHPSCPNSYLIGIECDGATYHSSKSARDRDRLRQHILEGLGWKIYRIWSTDWFADPTKELKALLEFLEYEIKRQSTESQQPTEDATFPSVTPPLLGEDGSDSSVEEESYPGPIEQAPQRSAWPSKQCERCGVHKDAHKFQDDGTICQACQEEERREASEPAREAEDEQRNVRQPHQKRSWYYGDEEQLPAHKTEQENQDLSIQPYTEYTKEFTLDPDNPTNALYVVPEYKFDLEALIGKIIECEGPMYLHCLYQSVRRASTDTYDRLTPALKRKIERVVEEGVQSTRFILEHEQHSIPELASRRDDPEFRIVRMHGAPEVRVRERGERDFLDIPVNEVKLFFDSIMRSSPLDEQDTRTQILEAAEQQYGITSPGDSKILGLIWDDKFRAP